MSIAIRGLSDLIVYFQIGMKFKQTARKYCTGLPRATFKKSLKKQRSAAKETLKVKIGQYCKNQIPSDSEEVAGDWTDLTAFTALLARSS